MASIEIVDDQVPLKRPHFELRDGQIFFLLSKRPYATFDAEGASLWQRIDGSTTVGQLRETCPDVALRLQRMWDLGICELVPSRFPQHRRRVLVIEPHMDDAALSVGGLMWSRREECDFTLVSVAGRSNFTSYYFLEHDYFDVDDVSRLRQRESELVMRLLGGRHAILDKSDAPLRFQPGNWTREWYRRNRRSINAFLAHCSTTTEIESWAAAIEGVLAASDAAEIWLPLGVGGHADHELTRNACLRALTRLPGLEQRTALYFYQDVPYANQFPSHTDQIVRAIEAAGGIVEQQYDDITRALGGKLRLNAIFGSQFKLNYMAPKIEMAARSVGTAGSGCGELRFRVRRLPGPIDQMAVYSGRKSVTNLVARLAGWYPRHRNTRRIRILSPIGVGRWDEDMAVLLEAFPRAAFEVHISASSLGETARLVSPRIEICTVDGRGLAWAARLLRIAVSRPWPLIVLVGEQRQRAATIIRAACILADPLPATTMNHLVHAMRIAGNVAA